MLTQCPHCQTIFKVTAAHLNIAQGHVRCSHCRNIFNASHNLLKQLPKQGVPDQFKIDEDRILTQDDNIPELLQEDIYEVQGQHWGSFLFWGVMTILLATLLTGQVLWVVQHDKVLQHPQVRPWLDRFCHAFLCTLPPTRDLSSFYMEEHSAQVHPEQKDVIQFEVMFINNAIFPQPYPDLRLTFEDLNGQPIAQRRFKPSEYLPIPPKPRQEIAAKASVNFKLELINVANLIEGNKIAEGYHFEFL